MSEQMMITKIEELKELEAFIEELKAEADGIRDSIKEQMTADNTEEMTVGQKSKKAVS